MPLVLFDFATPFSHFSSHSPPFPHSQHHPQHPTTTSNRQNHRSPTMAQNGHPLFSSAAVRVVVSGASVSH